MTGVGEDRPATIWVAVLYISDRVAEKLIRKHRIDPDEARSAVHPNTAAVPNSPRVHAGTSCTTSSSRHQYDRWPVCPGVHKQGSQPTTTWSGR